MQNLQAFSTLLFEIKHDDHLEIGMLIVRLSQELVSILWLKWHIRLSVSLISQHHHKNHHQQVNQHSIFILKDLDLHHHKVEQVLLCCLSSSWWLSHSAEDEKFEWWKHCCSWSWWIFKNTQEEDVNEEDEIWNEHQMYIISYLTSFFIIADKTDLYIVTIICKQCLDVESIFIHNLKDNSLKQAWLSVANIHISYLYIADFQPGLLFILYTENWELYLLNFLHQRANKHWMIIRSSD